MAPIHLLFAAGLLAIASIAEARIDKIQVNQWNVPGCKGHTSSPQFELQAGECWSLMAHSIKVQAPHNELKYFGWFRELSDLSYSCGVQYFSDPDCRITRQPTPGPDGKYRDTDYGVAALPWKLTKCVSPEDRGRIIRSIKFVCPHPFYQSRPKDVKTKVGGVPLGPLTIGGVNVKGVKLLTQTVLKPLWTTDPTGGAVIVPTTQFVTELASERSLPTLMPRARRSRYVWMLNPFNGADVCYICWQKHGVHFECESGLDTVERECGQNPRDNFRTIPVATTTQFVRITEVPRPVVQVATKQAATKQVAARQAVTKRGTLKKKVMIQDPFLPSNTCATVKWKHNGKHAQKLVIKGPRSCPKNGKIAYPIWINRAIFMNGTATVVQPVPATTRFTMTRVVEVTAGPLPTHTIYVRNQSSG
ncbi:hypothetical protein BU24DRAFT_491759 [Aaosphaeria arxii CBS 175.79]|uniref:Lytic polysaccharide monooxygenase n=1 Tax=Aaosphaeria arxii CBS 175.79 TaxID=1450172 RepID=A0A6A5XQF6_9PLEO|nr:uncharacterized protein BU24DRAFT_491759 [Aaosphaeria arxii CBS 175.79]KAF2015525.1 hypothetical protein BU24DRAFT_491759 [Aaosphaeria arxii CBS 175.79]